MPTVTQRHMSENEVREGEVPGFVPGTESRWPGRAEKRRLIKENRRKIAKMMQHG